MKDKSLKIRARYYARYTEPIAEQKETTCHYAEVDWSIPLDRVALVCLDVWNMDLHRDMRERDDRITRERIVPVMAACRERGLQLIHAPSPPIARRHPNWVRLAKDPSRSDAPVGSSPWPPLDFRSRRGAYASYAVPGEALKLKSWQAVAAAEFHELVRPEQDEPVVADGEELHRLCAKKGILFLLFAGFHTPGCMTGRDYGVVKMHARGYDCVLLRDCTNGMETHETFREQISMRGTIAFLEQTGIHTLTSTQLIEALECPDCGAEREKGGDAEQRCECAG